MFPEHMLFKSRTGGGPVYNGATGYNQYNVMGQDAEWTAKNLVLYDLMIVKFIT